MVPMNLWQNSDVQVQKLTKPQCFKKTFQTTKNPYGLWVKSVAGVIRAHILMRTISMKLNLQLKRDK